MIDDSLLLNMLLGSGSIGFVIHYIMGLVKIDEQIPEARIYVWLTRLALCCSSLTLVYFIVGDTWPAIVCALLSWLCQGAILLVQTFDGISTSRKYAEINKSKRVGAHYTRRVSDKRVMR